MSIKKLRAKLHNIAEEMDNEIVSRGIYFDEKSEKWQESEKGESYLEETNALEEAVGLVWESLDYMGED